MVMGILEISGPRQMWDPICLPVPLDTTSGKKSCSRTQMDRARPNPSYVDVPEDKSIVDLTYLIFQ
jgi:hypothetical protein